MYKIFCADGNEGLCQSWRTVVGAGARYVMKLFYIVLLYLNVLKCEFLYNLHVYKTCWCFKKIF